MVVGVSAEGVLAALWVEKVAMAVDKEKQRRKRSVKSVESVESIKSIENTENIISTAFYRPEPALASSL